MKRSPAISMFILLAIVGASEAGSNGYSPPKEIRMAQQKAYFADKTPEQIARFFAAPNGAVANAAISSMADRGAEVIPYLQKLSTDTHPWVRYGALKSLHQIVAKNIENGSEKPEQVEALMDMCVEMAKKGETADMAAVIDVLDKTEVEPAALHKLVLVAAAHENRVARTVAIKIAGSQIEDPEVIVKVGIAASGASNNVNRMWSQIHRLFTKHPDAAKVAIPTVADFLDKEAIPLRGMFASVEGPLQLLEYHAKDPEVVKLLPIFCRVYTRKGWSSQVVRDTLVKMDKAAVPGLRKFIVAERKFMDEAPDELFGSNDMPFATRKTMAVRIKELEHIADCLEAGRPFSIEFADVEKKLFEDSPLENIDMGALELDLDLKSPLDDGKPLEDE